MSALDARKRYIDSLDHIDSAYTKIKGMVGRHGALTFPDVLEDSNAQISGEMQELMADPTNGLYSVLGFHLPREGTGALVGFRSVR
jgi:hypothetical protein